MKILLSLLWSLAPLVSTANEPTVQALVETELPSLLSIYKDIHSHPELAGQERRTSAIVADELRATGCAVIDHVGKYERPGLTAYGVVGLMKNGDGPTILVRTDMDALPLKEQTNVPYASSVTATTEEGKEVSVMHACGHDAHISIFIGTARILAKLKDRWRGTLIFVGQPAEEIGAGAKALLADGLYMRFGTPAFVLALHGDSDTEVGKVGFTEGYAMASVDSVDVTVRGVGGHGAYPHMGKDPIVLSAEIVQQWQTIVSRENDPANPIVVTVGSIHAGTAYNIIPAEVKMQLTVRAYDKGARDHILGAIARIAKGCAFAAGIAETLAPTVAVQPDQSIPSTFNNPEFTRRVARALSDSLGRENVVTAPPTMASEDFSEYSLPDHSVPALIFRLGAVDPTQLAEARKTGSPLPGPHSSKFAPVAEPMIRTGIVAMTNAVLALTNN